MATSLDPIMREQLLQRRHTLQRSISESAAAPELMSLLQQVDQALERMHEGTYGLCEVCHEPVEAERLAADPLTCFCLDHLSAPEQRALERDLQLARSIQKGLLPNPDTSLDGWQICYHYQAAGPVSGDYCDVVNAGERGLYFMVGDVSGKGIAAAMLMANLHALFRALISSGLPLSELVTQASRAFCETTLASHYATLVCGRALPSGEVELCNAGHVSPLHLGAGQVAQVPSTGLPLGMFCSQQFAVNQVYLRTGETLLLYSDGLTEAEDGAGTPYGAERLQRLVVGCSGKAPEALVSACLQDLAAFRGAVSLRDDLTVMAVRRSGRFPQ